MRVTNASASVVRSRASTFIDGRTRPSPSPAIAQNGPMRQLGEDGRLSQMNDALATLRSTKPVRAIVTRRPIESFPVRPIHHAAIAYGRPAHASGMAARSAPSPCWVVIVSGITASTPNRAPAMIPRSATGTPTGDSSRAVPAGSNRRRAMARTSAPAAITSGHIETRPSAPTCTAVIPTAASSANQIREASAALLESGASD